jgi:glycosyltransferase involved in cell wall biosynthesis
MNVLISAVSRFEKPSGICRSAANLANCLTLQPDISRVYLVVGEWQVSYFQENFHLAADRIEIVPIVIKNSSIARNWWYMTGLPIVAKKLNCPLVHLSFPVPIAAPLFTARIVLTLNDLYPFEIPENFGYPQVYLNQLFTRICLANCDGITCISSYTLRQLEKYFPKNRKPKSIIYISIDFEEKEPQKPSDLPFENSFVLTVAQHRKNKNLDILIRSFHKSKQSGLILSNASLVIVGSQGSETNSLIQLVDQLDLKDQVYFLSSLIDSELVWLYKQCHLMVLPSSVEGLGLPVIESLHYNCHVICSDIPTLREIGGSQCEFFSLEGDPVENLTQILLQVWNRSERHTKPDTRFDKKTISDQYISFYKSLLPFIQSDQLASPSFSIGQSTKVSHSTS